MYINLFTAIDKIMLDNKNQNHIKYIQVNPTAALG